MNFWSPHSYFFGILHCSKRNSAFKEQNSLVVWPIGFFQKWKFYLSSFYFLEPGFFSSRSRLTLTLSASRWFVVEFLRRQTYWLSALIIFSTLEAQWLGRSSWRRLPSTWLPSFSNWVRESQCQCTFGFKWQTLIRIAFFFKHDISHS